jgi:hypothetical protein
MDVIKDLTSMDPFWRACQLNEYTYRYCVKKTRISP